MIEQETRRERDELTELDSSPVNPNKTRLFSERRDRDDTWMPMRLSDAKQKWLDFVWLAYSVFFLDRTNPAQSIPLLGIFRIFLCCVPRIIFLDGSCAQALDA